MKKIVFTIVLSFSSLINYAQTESVNISEQQRQQFENQVTGYINDFCYYLSDLSGNKDGEDKSDFKKILTALFVNTATVEVKSVSRPDKVRKYPVKMYFDLVGTYSDKYAFSMLEFYQVTVDTKHLKDTVFNGKEGYVGNFSFWQRFRAAKKAPVSFANDETPKKYEKEDFIKAGSDDTKKTGKYYIIKKKTFAEGDTYIVLLGDITAGEIKRYN